MSFSSSLACVCRLLLPVFLANETLADVIYVDARGNSPYVTIQAGIDAAFDGDVLLVRSGTYAGFTLNNRSLSIVSDAGAEVKVDTTVVVRNLSANASVLLSGLAITGEPRIPPGTAPHALELQNNAGHVRVQDCALRGGEGLFGGFVQGAHGGQGVSIQGSAKVAFSQCSLTGGHGGGVQLFYVTGGNGGHGAVTQGSVVAFYECVFQGGVGGEADYIQSNMRAGDGGDGCQVLDFGIVASGCQFIGGMGGSGATIAGDGGDGIQVNNGQAQLIGDSFTGGLGGMAYGGAFGASGLPQAGPGVFNVIPGAARKLSAPLLAGEGTTLHVNVSGEPGDAIWILRSPQPGFLYKPASAGILLVPQTTFGSWRPHAVLPLSGTATVDLLLPPVPAGIQVQRQYWQCMAVDSAGLPRLGSALSITVLNCSDLLPDCNANGSCDSCDLLLPGALDCDHNGVPDACDPDCNANGIADGCDILNGTSLDGNRNSIPDECEIHPMSIHVDGNASPGGNGSVSAPFNTIGAAFAYALSGDTVLVANGLYQGAANRDLDFQGRDLIVESSGGASNCVIDCQLLGRAFTAGSGVPPTARIQGFTIRNGTAGSSPRGGGISVDHSNLVIRDCRFEFCKSNSASGGGGLGIMSAAPLIQGCEFVGNIGGGVDVYLSTGVTRFVDCSFVNNVGHFAANVLGSVRFQRCLFQGNPEGGIQFGNGLLDVDQCVFIGNGSNGYQGGAIHAYNDSSRISNCTVVGNHAYDAGGAFYFTGNPGARTCRNTIFRDNTATNGTAIKLNYGPLNIAWCDVQGGQASVSVSAAGNLAWGPGNFDLDPLFADPDGPDNNPATPGDNDYRLSQFSPCVDAGENASVAPDWFDLDGDGNVSEPVPYDFDGNARFVDVLSAPNTGSGTSPLVDLGPWERP